MRLQVITCALLLAATVVTTARAQKPFEGIIDARINTPMGSATASYSIKGERLRMDMNMEAGMQTAMIFDRLAHKTYLLIPGRQTYIERDLPDTMPAAAGAHAGHALVWTGRKETIAGLSCDDATVTEDDGTKIDMCVAKGITYAGRGGMGRGGANAWQAQVQGGFPLKVQRVGEATPLFEATKVRRKSLGDDVFAPPAGWQKMSMPMGMPLGPR